MLKLKGIYRHYKGKYYLVEDVAINSDTLEKYVVYRALYGDMQLWIRPYRDFVAKIEGQTQKHRFELVDIEDFYKKD